ncbi:MAG: hypothetical protein PHR68_03735 [Candidatus Gracilibacteria bacterium]|nr:hypothetical protein [Candidatus Gracilibacteria bacterium]
MYGGYMILIGGFFINIGYFKKNNIFIKIIEVFVKNDMSFYPPDFYYNGDNINENYKLLSDFIKIYKNKKRDDLIFSCVIKDEILNNKINTLIYKKYKNN